MSGREGNRVFVGGLAWETSHRQLQHAFSRYGHILECVVVADRDTGRPRGFGFVTFADHRAMDDAISDMNGRELDGRVISVNKAKPKTGDEDTGFELDPFDDRFSRGRFGGRDHLDIRDSRYESHDRYTSDRYGDRYAPAHEGYAGDRYADQELQNEYGGGRGYFRDGGPRPGGDRYGSGGPDRSDRGSYRDRTGPYDRHRRGDHLSSYDRY
ncbi:hypothetical protein TIFTF001_008477 [Ficus carica]|uniref:RRM domain-containing protein n=1 Tax=Ficus carica TaxID=3494 RepID=A0AA87ZUX8_FICCA|nr:hypothetical protein TIFTF001_008477 [Ficus carica]